MNFSKRKPNDNEALSIFVQVGEKRVNRKRNAQLTVTTLDVKKKLYGRRKTPRASSQAILNAGFASMPFGFGVYGSGFKTKVLCDVA